MAAAEQHVRLALGLPPRLLRFFQKFPPAQIAPIDSPSTATPSQTISIAENTSSSDPNAAASTIEVPLSTSETGAVPSSPAEAINSKRFHNPFLPFKNPRTGNWHAPAYSLRRQAELYKMAAEYHVLSLMPISHKHPEVKAQKRVEQGLKVQGTGVGKKVKGKLWERTLQGRLQERQRAMEAMPEMIKQWKERGHGRGWKKWPR